MKHPLPSGWQEVKLGDIATIIKVKNKENKNYPVLSNSAIYGVVLQEEYFYKKIASKNDTTNYYIVDIGNFIYNPRISENAPAGPINVNKLTKGIVSPLYTVFHVKKEYSDFIAFYLSSLLWVNYLKEIANYGARYDRLGINDKMLLSIPILLPPLEEQKRIAEVLSLCDDIIENLTELIEKKEQYKKGVMQRLLSGEVRFKGFTDEWKTVRLGNITEMSSGGTPNTKNKEYWNGNIVWVTIKDITSANNFLYDSEKKITKKGLENSSAKMFPINTILYAMYASIGECIISKVECTTSQAILGIECSEKIDFMFLYYLLVSYKNNAKRMRQTGTQPNLNKQIVSDFEFNIPSLEEQKKIAGLLSVIDEEIENLKKQLELRKQQKKGLMQKLLTGEVRI